MSNHSDSQDKQKGNATQDGSSVLEFPETKTIDTQAAEWLAKLDAETPTKADLQAFKCWVNQADEHRIAFEEMVNFWGDMNILTQAVLPREQLHSQSAPRIFYGFGLGSGYRFGLSSILNAITRRSITAAFAVLAVTVGLLTTTDLWAPSPELYITQVGEQKTIQLTDHSIVQLNTNSRLEVDYSDNYRRLKLIQGEAHFDVAHNPERPFEVHAGQGLVRAIGTAFTVHIRKIDIEVIVTEGTVELNHAEQGSQSQQQPQQSPQKPPSAPIISTNIVIAPNSNPQPTAQGFKPGLKVSAGNKVMYDKDLLDEVKLVVATQIEEQLSWRQGMLLFKGEPLQKVVDEVSRYTDLKIIIPERSARELKVGGLFKVGDTESLFEALRDGFGIHVKEVSSDVVYLISDENR